jgi:phosphatidylinositol alpha-mannosyltransferase
VRVALACPYAWDAPGGVQVHVRQLAEQLRGRGHEVLVLAPAWTAPRDPGVQTVGRPIRMRYQGTVAPICFTPASFLRVGRTLRRFRPDIVHAHEPITPSTGMFAAVCAPAPVVATFHAQVERSRLMSAAAPILRPVWRRLRVRIAVSEAASGFYRSRLGDGMRIVPNGCDVGLFSVAEPRAGLPGGRRMLWASRLEPKNGFPVAVEAFRRLAQRFPDLWFLVAGDGEDRSVVRRLPPESRDRVVMLGSVPHERLPPYHAGSELFVAPAVGQHSFGIVLVEAMAAGLPIVASDIAGFREVVRHDVEGLLVSPRDPTALAASIARVLTDPGLARRLGAAGRQRAQRYRWEVVVQEIEAAYSEACWGR